MKSSKLRRQQLDKTLGGHGFLKRTGWVREIREALEMSLEDLGQRMGLIKQGVSQLEKKELTGNVTIESLKRAAEALDCEFVYYFVPNKGLQRTYEEQAMKSAREITLKVDRMMALEKQRTSRTAREELARELAQDMIVNGDRRIWKTEMSHARKEKEAKASSSDVSPLSKRRKKLLL